MIRAARGLFDPAIPQHSAKAIDRERQLERARARYRYASRADNPLAPIAVAGRFPLSERYGPRWALPYLPQLFRSLKGALRGHLRRRLSGRAGAFDSDDLAALFAHAALPTPDVITAHTTDGAFARNWLDGSNPLLLQCVRDPGHLSARIAITDDAWARALPTAPSPAELAAAGRLFLVDYELLQRSLLQADLVGRDSRWRDKYLPAPVVLLAHLPGVEPLSDLVPVAIALDQPGARQPNPIYWRNAGASWRLAKTYVAAADVNLQALSSHLYRHHYVIEPIALSTHRQLAAEHPVHVLLEPHVAYTMAVNRAALNLLKRRGSIFDQLYAGRLEETRRILIRSHERWSLRALDLERDLDARGVAQHPVDYPWRDDARLWHAAIHRFVSAYLQLFYRTDADVNGDAELQAWFGELHADDGGNLRDLTATGRLATQGELRDLLAQILFIAGPGHAAVHFPQTDYFTYAPAHPAAVYLPPPRETESISEERIRASLPPFERGVAQFLNNQMAYYRFDRFGDYRAYALGRVERAGAAIGRLHQDLGAIESCIEERNRARRRPYRYLLPSLVPNSINI
jgi:arachidonate 15-lipoxygenase